MQMNVNGVQYTLDNNGQWVPAPGASAPAVVYPANFPGQTQTQPQTPIQQPTYAAARPGPAPQLQFLGQVQQAGQIGAMRMQWQNGQWYLLEINAFFLFITADSFSSTPFPANQTSIIRNLPSIDVAPKTNISRLVPVRQPVDSIYGTAQITIYQPSTFPPVPTGERVGAAPAATWPPPPPGAPGPPVYARGHPNAYPNNAVYTPVVAPTTMNPPNTNASTNGYAFWLGNNYATVRGQYPTAEQMAAYRFPPT
ncbi:hypothetical protein BZA77DRAFT_291983 [Pyronema omphalodes]|nr:hypothetical protein BZA77DRAFT_291983 [Pyronema omphalodes]